MDSFAPTDKTRLRRRSPRGSFDRAQIEAILDEGLLCHVGFTDEHGPVVIPTAYARDGDALLLHGAPASRLMKQAGRPLCIVVTLIDGLVIARSAMHHSMNYRSVIVFGQGELVVDRVEKLAALERVVEHLVPGRSAHTRGPNEAELTATAVLRIPLVEVSAKIRKGGPVDDEADLALPHWAGELPLSLVPHAPEGAPDHLQSWHR
ncbi:MAG TPA: pyridoxamine 5'-phosphate oxidase family protein [Nannocystaceae bacterium]|nr:pyridoxamine 5'-phosphate oxidase family protein [Nannocystaceae bacterium]